MNVYLAQVNYRFGNNAFLPYSVGQLWTYASQATQIRDRYQLCELLVFREHIEKVIHRMRKTPPDVLGVSCYIWNWSYSLKLMMSVRIAFPDCLIIAGGPQIPKDEHSQHRLLKHIDVLVHGEGERTFAKLLLGVHSSELAGVSYRENGNNYIGNKNNRADTLDQYPSPYLRGTFDDLLKQDHNWHVLQETNRGCPYQCTFCDWGSATFSQVREFPLSRIEQELQWCADNKIDLLYNCDANFGMLKRDQSIADIMIQLKQQYGFPQKLRAAYAKKTTPRLYETGKALAKADMSKGVTLSAQSMHLDTLKAVKRRPLDEPEFRDLMSRYSHDSVPTYTEIILGLPLETAQTFKRGLTRLLELGQHEGINVYPSIMLANSEMNDPAYREKYKIQTTRVPMMLLHGTPDEYPEYYDLVTSTSTMSKQEWIDCLLFAWTIQALHCLGFARQWAIRQHTAGIDYLYTYQSVIDDRRGLFKTIFDQRQQILTDTLEGLGNWNEINYAVSDVVYPPEEVLFMRCVENRDTVYSDLGIPPSMALRCRQDYADPAGYTTLAEWARETVWYSRKGKRKKAA